MKSGITWKRDVYAFCQVFVYKFVDCSKGLLQKEANYATEVINLGLFHFNVKESAGKRVEVATIIGLLRSFVMH